VIMDEYSKMHGFSPAVVTASPWTCSARAVAGGDGARRRPRAGGISQGRGKGEVRGKTFAIQGFGNVGSWAARFLHERGGVVVAVSDVKGGVRNPEGLDIPRLIAYQKQETTVSGFPGSDPIGNEDLLLLPVDVLVPAALGGVITEANVKTSGPA